jgi:hypothetical protein
VAWQEPDTSPEPVPAGAQDAYREAAKLIRGALGGTLSLIDVNEGWPAADPDYLGEVRKDVARWFLQPHSSRSERRMKEMLRHDLGSYASLFEQGRRPRVVDPSELESPREKIVTWVILAIVVAVTIWFRRDLLF